MSKPYTENQAARKADQIFKRFGVFIHVACADSGVGEDFLAGFVGVEAGIDADGLIDVNAKRFEKGVYEDLISLRDRGYCYVGGKKRNTYSGVRREQIADANNDAIRNLATSWGMSQIMGWHIINNLKCSLEDLRDFQKHFRYTIQLLKIVSGEYLAEGDLEAVLHIWNTGSANGKTYHADYVENALKVKKYYAVLLKQNKDKFSKDSSAADAVGIHETAALEELKGESSSSENHEGANEQKQIAENIINNGDKTVPDNFVAEDKTVVAPPPSGMMKKAVAWLAGLGVGIPSLSATVETIKNYSADGTINIHDVFQIAGIVGKFVLPYAAIGGFIFIAFWGIKELLKQVSLIVKIWVTGKADMHNVEVKPFVKKTDWRNAPVKTLKEEFGESYCEGEYQSQKGLVFGPK